MRNVVLWFLNSDKLNGWVSQEDLGFLWATYYTRRLEGVAKSNTFTQLIDLIPAIISKKDTIVPSETGIQLLFEEAISVLMKDAEYSLFPVPEPFKKDKAGKLLMAYSSTVTKLLNTFTSSEEFFTDDNSDKLDNIELLKATADKYCEHVGINPSDYFKGFLVYDCKIHAILEEFIKHSKTKTFEEVQKIILKANPFLAKTFSINFKDEESKQLYFRMSAALIRFLCRHKTESGLMKILIQHMLVVQMEFLITSFPAQTDELMNLLQFTVTTSPFIEFDYVQRLNRYLILKLMLTKPILTTHTRLLYQMLIFTFNGPFEFPNFENQLGAHSAVIHEGMNTGVDTIIQRALEMHNEIPANLIDETNLSDFTLIFKLTISKLSRHYKDILFAEIPNPPRGHLNMTFNDYFVDILCSNKILSNRNPYRSTYYLSYAGVVANSYLTLITQAKSCFKPNDSIFPTKKLFDCFLKVQANGLCSKQEDTLLPLLSYLYKIVATDLTYIHNSKHFYKKLEEMDLIDFLLGLPLYKKESEKPFLKIIQDFFTDLIDLIITTDSQPACEFIRKKIYSDKYNP